MSRDIKSILSKINEEWLMTMQKMGPYNMKREDYGDVFVNPSRKDIIEMDEFIRFIADGRAEKLYIVDAFGGIFHAPLYKKLGINHKEVIAGGFRYNIGKLMLLRDEAIALYDNEESLLKGEWRWMEKYYVDMVWFEGIVNVDRVRRIDDIQGLSGSYE